MFSDNDLYILGFHTVSSSSFNLTICEADVKVEWFVWCPGISFQNEEMISLFINEVIEVFIFFVNHIRHFTFSVLR